MRKLLMSSVVLTTFAMSIAILQISCKKQAIAEPVSLTKEQILVQKTWRVDRLHHVINNVFSTYTSGGTNTTGISYDKLRFTFNADGTGTHINDLGNVFTLKWQFTTSDKRTLLLTINAPTPVTNTWEMVELAGNYMHASVNLVIKENPNNIETFRLIQIP